MKLNGLTQKGVYAALLSTFLYLIGGWDVLVEALLVAIALDFVGGVIHAYYDGRLNSREMRRGIIRKSAYFAVLILAVMLDRTVFHSQPIARTLVGSFLLITESLSVLEHAAGVGVPIPKWLVERLERLRERQTESGQDGNAPS